MPGEVGFSKQKPPLKQPSKIWVSEMVVESIKAVWELCLSFLAFNIRTSWVSLRYSHQRAIVTIGLYDYKVVFMVEILKTLVHSMVISNSLMVLVKIQCIKAVNAAMRAYNQ